MKILFTGHRGTGKTALLERHRQYFPEVKHFDLDEEIEDAMEQNLREYFLRVGEQEFRQTEKDIFRKIFENNRNFVISLGAGFDMKSVPADAKVIFVSRTTDSEGRIFTNRPRLDSDCPPLDEYRRRYELRDGAFRERADRIYHLPEGQEGPDAIEKKILSEDFEIGDAYYTLSARELPILQDLMQTYRRIELRSDLLLPADIETILKKYSEHDWLVSVRTIERFDWSRAKKIDVDFWYYFEGCQIVSSHTDAIIEGIQQLAEIKENVQLKLCPLVNSFEDLIIGYRWQQQNPEQRSFLPRSSDGRWIWYRQCSKYFQKINFIKNFTEVLDQPSLYEWMVLPEAQPARWAALLGKPAHFSRSPREHQDFFAARATYMARLQINADELRAHLSFLIEMGLGYASVTSPLKEEAYRLANVNTATADQLQAVNTWWMGESEIHGHNTDLAGFRAFVEKLKPTDKVAIWGGGGTLEMMKAALPQAVLYSSRNARPRTGQKDSLVYDYLVWAAPRAEHTLWPPEELSFAQVLDLNYTENSMGLEFAAEKKISYISGLLMFREQARGQREFWSENERK